MNITQQGVITLLKAAVTGKAGNLPPEFDIAEAQRLMKRHHVSPLLYEGALRCGISAQDETMRVLFRKYCRTLQISEGQMREVRKIREAFDENGIDYMPLKGCRLKAIYPSPELRTMGDADILIRLEQYDRIKPLMVQLGFREGHETDHELVWRSDALHLELHKHLIPSYNKDLYSYFGTGWQRAIPVGGGCHIMSKEDEFIFLFTHFAKHFRDGGIGCRHVIDLWMYLRAFGEPDGAYLHGELEKTGLAEFYDNIRVLLDAWFEGAPWDEKTELISEIIFASGSFGQDQMRTMSHTLRDSRTGNRRKNGRLVYLLQTAFPDTATLREKYPVLQKAPWMLPAVWAYRPFYKVLREGKTLKKQKDHLQALSNDNLDAYQQMLRYVGLDFRF